MRIESIQKPESIVEACERQLRSAILEGDIAPGERLPPERELAERFGVNRVTVRSALTRLARQNLVAVRQGSGYVVRDYRRVGGPELLPGLYNLARTRGDRRRVVEDLLKVRRHLARAVLEALSAGVGEAALGRVERAVDAFAATASSGASTDAIARADVDVLAALLDATESPVLGLCLNPIASVLASMPELRGAMYMTPEDNALGWRALLGWLAAPDEGGIDLIAKQLALRDEATLARMKFLEET